VVHHVRLSVVSCLCLALCLSCLSCSRSEVRGSSWGVYRAPSAGQTGPQAEAEAPSVVFGQKEAMEGAEEVGAPERVPDSLTLRDAFLLALRANKQIRVAALDTDISEQLIRAAKGEFDPTVFLEASRGRSNTPVEADPLGRTELSEGAFSGGVRQRVVTGTSLELTASTDYERELNGTSVINPSHEPSVTLGLTQDLLRDWGIDINRTDIIIAENNLAISQEDLRGSIIQRLFEVESAYWELYYAQADLDVRRKQLEQANELVRRAEAEKRVGRSAELDVKTAESSAAGQEVAILTAENRVTKLRRQLLKLLGVLDPSTAELEFELGDMPTQVPFEESLDEAVETAKVSRPDYARSQVLLENSAVAERFAANQRLPRLQIFGEYGLTGLSDEFSNAVDVLDDGDYNAWEVGLRFDVPIPNRTARSEYRIAQLQREQARVRLAELEEEITREVANALADLRTSEARIGAAMAAQKLAEDVLAARDLSFKMGRTDNLEVLRAQDSLAAAERDTLRARIDYAIALANLLRVQGVLLERKGVAFAPAGRQQ